ncbi:PBP1A family penicillin-binding protein [Novosphingobium sp. KCTC 2891]|uniref:transglycosylase domain-containing protein n=1 Tax=Novosphingobium sp. KCTC 2891 TaxID=2989730 RepID=UPI002221E21D|nr:PBP1A family penicillin-binding protein [Novosphingobium sp. KCTC 2891]MCW1383320.1 PBP1A family penicillin-binding protein [Novosphingobium sp. KCTC 2891]
MARRDTPRRPEPDRRSSRSEREGSFLGRMMRRLIVWGGGFALLGALGVAVAVLITARSLPGYERLKSSQAGQMIVVRANDGSEIVTLGPSYGKWVPYSRIPQVMKDAMISVEDRRFRDHWGVDPIGIVRSVMVRFETGRWRQGGSTITQQLARNIFLNNSRTFDRKIREAVLAMAIESKFTKNQILELYLNKVYFGGGAYGVDSAARKFFGHPGDQLSLEEAAIIAGLVKAPSHYSPTADAQAAVDRAAVVIQTMQAAGAITPAEAAAANLKAVKLAPEQGQNSARYFTDWVLPQLDLLLPDIEQPIEVWTTLDPVAQRAATSSLQGNVPSGVQGALVSVDRDGGVLAMVGGTDYVTSNYNRAVNAVRQPGSAWKLFVYLAALEAGYTPDDRVVDEPVTIQGWSPRNSGGTYAGPIDVRTAFAYSKNTVAAQLGNEVGFGAVANMARRFGISTPINTQPSMVLGTSDVRVIDMVRAFAEVQAKGTSVVPYGIRKVTTTDGEVLYSHRPDTQQQLVPTYVAAAITDLLQTAVSTGTGRAAQIGRPVAGKTGTTSSNKDGWFLGFSSGITTGVWMGRDDAKPVPGLQGGTAPARAFAAYMKVATAKRPVEKFETELKLPQWQLEPDDEVLQNNPDDYFYVDPNGNVVDQGGRRQQQDGQGAPDQGVPVDDGSSGGYGAAPAANDDFLDRATGQQQPDPAGRQRPMSSGATRYPPGGSPRPLPQVGVTRGSGPSTP